MIADKQATNTYLIKSLHKNPIKYIDYYSRDRGSSAMGVLSGKAPFPDKDFTVGTTVAS